MCIFCKIVNKEIPSHCIYEDDTVMAFLDISQAAKGHTLVIPKAHYDHFLNCDEALMKHVFEVAQMLGKRLQEALHADGLNILSNVGAAAGQSVSHFHVHLIPRYETGENHVTIAFADNAHADADIEATLALLKQ